MLERDGTTTGVTRSAVASWRWCTWNTESKIVGSQFGELSTVIGSCAYRKLKRMRRLEWEGNDINREVGDESDVTAEGLGRKDASSLSAFRIDRRAQKKSRVDERTTKRWKMVRAVAVGALR
jgi:hypothetical protein